MKHKTAVLFSILSVFVFQACDKDYLFAPQDSESGDVQILSRDYTKWVFFSFEKGDTIGACDAMDSIAMQSWYERRDWDMAFHRQDIKTNSGVSGSGEGGVLAVEQEVFDFDAVREAPEDGYIVDVPDSVIYDMSQMMLGKIGYAYTGTTKVTDGWAVLTDMMSSLWEIKQKAYIVRTGTGKYAKIYLKRFQDDRGQSGLVTMQYSYQPDGSVYFTDETSQ